MEDPPGLPAEVDASLTIPETVPALASLALPNPVVPAITRTAQEISRRIDSIPP